MAIVLMTANRWKIAEYRRFLSRHAQPLIVEAATESPEMIAGWLQTARAVLADESNIFDLAGDLVHAAHVGPARNICRLHAWVRDPVKGVVRKTYIREVRGEFDATQLRPDDPTVFDWDSAFTSAAGTTLEAMDRAGLKSSAREQCLSALARAMLHHRAPKRLRWTEAETGSWSTDLGVLTVQPLYADLPPPLQSAMSMVIEQGVFFRAARSRRDGNYWLPGLNGGVPYVPKGDPIHEATYMFHDLMHQLLPDLVFDGADSLDHKRVYIAHRMMSEGVSLVLADMVFAESLAQRPEHAGYDFTRRKILPLYRAIDPRKRADLRWLLKQVCGFVLTGDPGALPAETEAWRAFATKYSRFFIADFQWTRMNWQSLTSRSAMSRHWIDLVHPGSFRPLGVWFISELVDEIGRGVAAPALCDSLFDIVWSRRIEPALTRGPAALDPATAVSAGFRRWLTGQLALFSHYAPVVVVPPLAYELAARIRDPRPFGVDEIATIRQRFGDHVRALARDGVISDDDAAIYPDLFPLFDPFFLRDYDEAQQEVETVADASALAFTP